MEVIYIISRSRARIAAGNSVRGERGKSLALVSHKYYLGDNLARDVGIVKIKRLMKIFSF
jgi:hypothetical protein